MDEITRKRLETIGIDVDEALGRFLNNESLMMKFLLRFPSDENFSRLKQALDCQDSTGAFEAAHTLKGVTGNLSMKSFYQQISSLVEDLRGGALASAEEKMPALESQYTQIVSILNQLS